MTLKYDNSLNDINEFEELTIVNTKFGIMFGKGTGFIKVELPISTHNEICDYGLNYVLSQNNGRCIRSILIEWTQLLVKKIAFNAVSIVIVAIFKILSKKYEHIFQKTNNLCNVLLR